MTRFVLNYSCRATVRLGDFGDSDSNKEAIQEIGIDSVKIHEEFDPIRFHRDIAILKLNGSAVFNGKLYLS
jgi:Trypsin